MYNPCRMLQKTDRKYYKGLGYTQGLLGFGVLFLCFVAGVSATYHMSEIHLFAPYWIGIPRIMEGLCALAAARTGKRWPLAIWIPLFVVSLCGTAAYLVTLPAFKLDFFEKYPCYLQTNYKTQDTRCICAYDEEDLLMVGGAESIEPCVRALNILLIGGNLNYLLCILALIPEFLLFVLVCNDLCCLSCRRAALIPQVVLQSGSTQQYVQVQSETVTYRTDEERPGTSAPGTSVPAANPPGDAGPLPQKPTQIPHSY